jgi:hypothetical protein
MSNCIKSTFTLTILTILLWCAPSFAIENEKDITELVNTEIKVWARNEIIINAIKAQNEKNADLSVIDMKVLENKWVNERLKNKHQLINKVMGNEVSAYLKDIQNESKGLYTEIIVTDNKGINVGQSIISTNYWQGLQPKWEKTLGSNSYGTYIGELKFDDNTELFQVEVSFILMDADTPIGIVYAGIDIERLAEWKKQKEE